MFSRKAVGTRFPNLSLYALIRDLFHTDRYIVIVDTRATTLNNVMIVVEKSISNIYNILCIGHI